MKQTGRTRFRFVVVVVCACLSVCLSVGTGRLQKPRIPAQSSTPLRSAPRGSGQQDHMTYSALRPPPSAVAGSSRHLRRYFLQCLRIAYCVSPWWRQGFSTSAPALRQQDQSRAPPRDPEAPLVKPAPLLVPHSLPPSSPSSAGMAHTPCPRRGLILANGSPCLLQPFHYSIRAVGERHRHWHMV